MGKLHILLRLFPTVNYKNVFLGSQGFCAQSACHHEVFQQKKPFKTYGNSAEWNFKITLSSREFVPFNQHFFFLLHVLQLFSTFCLFACFVVGWARVGNLSLHRFGPFSSCETRIRGLWTQTWGLCLVYHYLSAAP